MFVAFMGSLLEPDTAERNVSLQRKVAWVTAYQYL